MADTAMHALERERIRLMRAQLALDAEKYRAWLVKAAENIAEELTDAGHAEGWLPVGWSLAMESRDLNEAIYVRYGTPEPEGYRQITCGAGKWAPGAGNEWDTVEAAEQALAEHARKCGGAHAIEFVPGRKISDGQG